MRKKLDHSKMSTEELAKTQVLNLNDVEELANYEKTVSKKPAIIVGIIGLFALTIGAFYPKIVTFLDTEKDENVVYNRVDNDDDEIYNSKPLNETNTNTQLTCMKAMLANPDGTDLTLTYNFTFVNNALQSYTKLAIYNINATNPSGTVTVENVYNTFATLSQTPIVGYYLQTSKTSNGVTVSMNADLTKFSPTTLPDTHKTYTISNVEYALSTTKEAITQTSAANGFTCR